MEIGKWIGNVTMEMSHCLSQIKMIGNVRMEMSHCLSQIKMIGNERMEMSHLRMSHCSRMSQKVVDESLF